MKRSLAGLAWVVLLAGCAGAPVRQALPPAQRAAAMAAQEAREARLAQLGAWSLEGRVALSNGTRGGSGAFAWTQRDDRYEVSLSAPITHKSWRISGEPGGIVRLEGLEGGPRSGTDAGALLRAATGWEIPVAALADWARGVRHPGGGPAVLTFTTDARLGRLEQDGWILEFDRWSRPPGSPVELPGRVNARRGDARVRLVVDAWQLAPAAAPATP